MRVLGIDLETTGLDFKKDRVIELGAVLWDVERKIPLKVFSDLLTDEGIQTRLAEPDAKEIVEGVVGLSAEDILAYGTNPAVALRHLDVMADCLGAEYIIAHNGQGFDKPFLKEEYVKLGLINEYILSRPWIDTRLDLPFVAEPSSRRLVHLAADHGFINPFAHRALFDVLTMLKLMGHYDFAAVAAQSKIPFITVRAMVGYEDREKAKAQRFLWEKIGDKVYPKCWVKEIRENKLEEFQKACDFQVVRLSP